jgi:microcystin-dependent protein
MPAVQSGRFNLWTWPSNSDEFSRSQMDESHRNIETFSAVFRQDTFANRGTASAWSRSFFYDTTNAILYFSDGTNWKKITDLASSTASMVAVNPTTTTADAGTSDQGARIDHRHATPPWGTSVQSTHTANTTGSLAEFARVDHRHAIGASTVTAGAIASSAINNSNLFTAGVVDTNAIGSTAVTKAKIATDQQIPSGAIWAFGGTTTPPTGWLFCNGAAFSTSVYPDLFAVIGYSYGGSSGTFWVPDLRDRIPRGATQIATPLGTLAGSDTVTITTANMPTHLHGFGSLAVEAHAVHSHTIGGSTGTTLGDHAHSMSHSHTASLASGVVSGGGGFIGVEWYYPPGGSGNRYQDGPYSMFDGGGGPQAEIGTATLLNTTVNVSSLSANTGNANLAHSHTLPANTGTLAAAQNHTFSGSTANTGSGNELTVTPKTQTVNYIIKT